jgi:aminoglycoside 6'-N-acetyltransferase
VGRAVRGRLTVVRPATDDDVDLLVAWHADPEVSRYWDDETYTLAEIRADFADPHVDHWIIEVGGEPVGFLQSWWEAGVGSTEPSDTGGPRRGGLDGFLIPEARGLGLMPDAARALARSLLDAGWEYVTVDPYAWNERALRGWRNAGFVEVSRHEPDAGHVSAWVLMRFSG